MKRKWKIIMENENDLIWFIIEIGSRYQPPANP